MKRFLITLLIPFLLISCATLETDTADPAPVEEEVAAVTEEQDVPAPAEEAPRNEKPELIVDRSERTQKEAPKAEEKPAPEPAPAPKAEETPQLKGKDLVNEITKIEREKSAEKAPEPAPAPAETAPAVQEKPAPAPVKEEAPSEAPAPAEDKTEPDPVVTEEAPVEEPEKVDVPPAPEPSVTEAVETPEPAAEPVVEEEVPVPAVEEAPVEEAPVEEAPMADAVTEEKSSFTIGMSGLLYSILIKLVVIIVIFTLACVINSRYGSPIQWPVAAILAMLLTAVPMLTSCILEGWNLWQLSYLIILATYFILRHDVNRKN